MYIRFAYIKYTLNLFYFFAILLAQLLHTAPMRLSRKRGFARVSVGIIVAYRDVETQVQHMVCNKRAMCRTG